MYTLFTMLTFCSESLAKRRSNLDSEKILAWLQKGGDVELSRQAAVLAVTHGLPIDPGVESVVHTIKLQKDPACHSVRFSPDLAPDVNSLRFASGHQEWSLTIG